MNLPAFGVRKPVTNLMIFSAIIIIAAYSLSRMGIDLMPEIEPPAITVIAQYPGASAEDVEIRVAEPLENQPFYWPIDTASAAPAIPGTAGRSLLSDATEEEGQHSWIDHSCCIGVGAILGHQLLRIRG